MVLRQFFFINNLTFLILNIPISELEIKILTKIFSKTKMLHNHFGRSIEIFYDWCFDFLP